jgi:hypothetical protein
MNGIRKKIICLALSLIFVMGTSQAQGSVSGKAVVILTSEMV